jgi:Lrp/AsnC family transcriptional regulator
MANLESTAFRYALDSPPPAGSFCDFYRQLPISWNILPTVRIIGEYFPMTLDKFDRLLLALLQEDAGLPLAELAERVGLSASPCWRRIQKLEGEGYIRARVALLDPKKMNVGVSVFAAIRTNQHNAEWLQAFSRAVVGIPEVVEVYRMSGQIDYMLRIVVPDIDAYDRVYKKLIAAIELYDVSSSFALEVLKSTTVLPVDYA